MLRKIQPCAERLGGIAGQRGKTEEDVDEYQKLADEELIQKLREGDERIMDYILEKYKPLVLRKANAMFLIGGDTDDLIQEGMIGLFKAIRDYRSDRETSFFHFAELCINRQLYSAVEASNRKKHVPLNTYVSFYSQTTEEGKSLAETLLTDQMDDPEQLVIEQENFTAFWEQLREQLSALERQVLDAYLEGKNYRQIAEELGKSPRQSTMLSRVSRERSGRDREKAKRTFCKKEREMNNRLCKILRKQKN